MGIAKKFPLASALPAGLLFCFLLLFFVVPVGDLLRLSFLSPAGEPTTMHYSKMFGSSGYLPTLITTFRISAWTTALSLLAAYPIAYFLATMRSANMRDTMILLVVMPLWTSFLVRTFAWIVLLGRNGAINRGLMELGIVDEPLRLIYNHLGVMIGMVHAMVPLAVLTMFPVMKKISPDYARAAMTMGARGAQAFWLIYFPLSLPGIAAAGLMIFITSIGFFITPVFLGGPGETMITQLIIEQMQTLPDWGLAGAVTMLLLATSLGIVFVYDRLFGMSSLVQGDVDAKGSSRIRFRPGALILNFMGQLGWLVGRCLDGVFPARRHAKSERGSPWQLFIVSILIAFLVLPVLFIIPVSFSESEFMEWPPTGFTWKWYADYFDSYLWLSGTLRSLLVGLGSATLAALIATPAAFALTRRTFPGKPLLFAFFLTPLIVPRIIIAMGLFYLYAKLGLIGTSYGLVIGHAVVSAPYVILTVMAVLRVYDIRIEQAAAVLGANRRQTFRYVTFPLVRSGLISAFLFAFIVSFDELTIAILTTGGLVSTLPKQMWDDALMRVSPGLAAVSTLMLIVITIVIMAAEATRRRTLNLRGGDAGR